METIKLFKDVSKRKIWKIFWFSAGVLMTLYFWYTTKLWIYGLVFGLGMGTEYLFEKGKPDLDLFFVITTPFTTGWIIVDTIIKIYIKHCLKRLPRGNYTIDTFGIIHIYNWSYDWNEYTSKKEVYHKQVASILRWPMFLIDVEW